MIFLVYATIAPISAYILAGCFIVMGGLFRHHFVYIYNPYPDSGGYHYLAFIRVLTTCLTIAVVTVTGLLALKKSPVATPLMLPLLICTVRCTRNVSVDSPDEASSHLSIVKSKTDPFLLLYPPAALPSGAVSPHSVVHEGGQEE
jgi:hypothetical protein